MEHGPLNYAALTDQITQQGDDDICIDLAVLQKAKEIDFKQSSAIMAEQTTRGLDQATTSQQRRLERIKQGQIVPLGIVEISKKAISNNQEVTTKVRAQMTSSISAMISSGCCGSHTTASINSTESSQAKAHLNCLHCECGGHIKNGNCDSIKCYKKQRTINIPVIQPVLSDVLNTVRPPTRSIYIAPPSSPKFIEPSPSIVEIAKARKQRAIVMLFGAYVQYLIT